jgi:presequence protease
VINEHCNGIAYYQYLKSLSKTKDFKFLQDLASNVFCWNNLIASYTGDIPEISVSKLRALSENTARETVELKPWGPRKESFSIPSDVSYATLGGKLSCEDPAFGKLALASHIISLEYLWNVIRVQGGAYGAALSVKESGFCGGSSYRDPSATQSLKSFAASGAFLEKVLTPERDLTGAIIGTVAETSPFRNTKQKGIYADSLYIKGTRYEDLCARRQELLNATTESLLPVAKKLETTLNENSSICVIGPKEQLAKCEGLKIISL